MFLQDVADRVEGEDIVAAEIRRRSGHRSRIDKSHQPQPHATRFLDHRRHLSRTLPVADNQQVVESAKAFAHDGDAPTGSCAANKQEDEIHGSHQQYVGAADVAPPQQVQAGVHDHQHNRQLADDLQDQLDGIGELQIAIEGGKVSHHRPRQQERHHQRQVVGEGINLRKTFAEELRFDQEAAQQVCHQEGDAGHPQVVEQRNRTKKLGSSIKHDKSAGS